MKNCIIHFLPALAGDCFVIEFHNKECVIIDCGYTSTYYNELKPLLIHLKNKGCKVILLIITHTDRDHIEGAIELIKENGHAQSPKIISIENIWYNGIFNTLTYNPELKKRINSFSAEQKQKIDINLANLLSHFPGSSSEVSASNCISFEQLCIKNGYNLNSCFNDNIVQRTYGTYNEKMNHFIQIGDCRFNILSPSNNEITKLSKELHFDMLRTLGTDYSIDNDSKFIKLCELILECQTDRMNYEVSISASNKDLKSWLGTSKKAIMNAINQASIVNEIQYGDIKMIFTGDSESSLWADLLDAQYDVIKLSHHGTTKPNIELLEHTRGITALISTNGSSNNRHPEKETIARAVLNGYENLYFNYSHPFKSVLQENQEQYGFRAFFEEKIIEL